MSPTTEATCELVVEKAVHRGFGLARLDGQVVLLPRALPGERVRARLATRERGVLRAEVVEVLEPAPERRPSPCAHFPECGGCAWQALDYAAQLRLKEAVLRESLARAGAAWQGPIPIRASPEEGWRTRATLHAAVSGGRLRIGLHRSASHDVVPVEGCLQLSGAVRDAVSALTAALEARDLGPAVADVRLAESGDGRHRAALLTLRERGKGVLDRLSGAVADLDAVDGVAAALPGGRPTRLRGDPVVHASVLGDVFAAHVASFFQANRFLLDPLVESVLEPVPPGAEVVDLFAGVGLFAIAAARRRGARALAVELAGGSTRDARANAARLAPEAVRVRRADARSGLRDWRPGAGPRVIVVDPPRTGLDRALLADLAGQRRTTRIVYVSCDPASLGRDLARFAGRGWHPARLEAFDLFPDTFHLESVVTLEAARV